LPELLPLLPLSLLLLSLAEPPLASLLPASLPLPLLASLLLPPVPLLPLSVSLSLQSLL
jgi:hypothetical protein